MRLRHLEVKAGELEGALAVMPEEDSPLIISVSDADTVTMLAGLDESPRGQWGVWLEASQDDSAGLIARDVKTMSMLTTMQHVVVWASRDAPAHAEIVVALLGDAPVTMSNAAGTLRAAYNRPAPAHPVTVWSCEGDVVRHAKSVLALREVRGALRVYHDTEE